MAVLSDRVAVITGSARGIGAAIAERFVAEGARVVVSDLDETAARATADRIGAVDALGADVRDEEQVRSLFATVAQRHGGVHVVVANAGVGAPVPLLGMDLAAWRAVTSVNLDGVFLTVRYGGEAVAASGGGSVLTLSSVTATTGSPLIAHYAAAKAGVLNLTKTAAVELRSHGVRVNALVPGFIGTELVTRAAPEFEKLLGLPEGGFHSVLEQKQGRMGAVEDLVSAAVYLSSDADASWVTGAGLVLDGGLTSSLL